MFTDENGGLALGDGCGNTARLEHFCHDESLLHRVSLLCVWGLLRLAVLRTTC